MDALHDIVLILIIGAIILVQVFVFMGNYRKIQGYKKTIEKTRDFKIVEVEVPEEWIKEVEVNDILRNPEAFQSSSSEFSSKMTEAPENDLDEESAWEEDSTLETEEFSEEIEFPDASEVEGDDEAYEDDFEYEEYKNNKR
jgi:hypothetical protein|tara:strand:- start:609 stop:1031 length:423 start_codon:yes stop_codon:yes gene_type:complete